MHFVWRMVRAWYRAEDPEFAMAESFILDGGAAWNSLNER
jgi:hypothetical protein